ncbi:hypothetical protein KFK09_028982 [Dendrobium nobile]|uniref:Uncharacterized protein n=1 Tax=Dendrobium nobile TaxID=94219 RepID=A0A8T3A541_DENNO|nr:hypothetical protein KFK09_028982 [Dendrobium nobile]
MSMIYKPKAAPNSKSVETKWLKSARTTNPYMNKPQKKAYGLGTQKILKILKKNT